MDRAPLTRRNLLTRSAPCCGFLIDKSPGPLRPIVDRVCALLDMGTHNAKGLSDREVEAFKAHQERARREFAVSGIQFDVYFVAGAFLRKQGYSEIPSKFMAQDAINLFVTDSLGYDIDRDRTGGCSIGPRPRRPGYAADPYFKTYLGLQEATAATLAHEYAHHFTLDTSRRPTGPGNLWADLRNDYLLWRQRHGSPVMEFRACERMIWARGVS